MTVTASAEFEKQWAKIIARSWRDLAYRQLVEANPAQALAEHGIVVPPGLIVTVGGGNAMTNNSTMNLPFPPKPDSLKAEDAAAEHVLAGSCCSSSLVSSSCCP